MKMKEIAAMTPVDLREKLMELRKELMKDRAQVAMKTTPKNPGKIRKAKKVIARIMAALAKSEVQKKA